MNRRTCDAKTYSSDSSTEQLITIVREIHTDI